MTTIYKIQVETDEVKIDEQHRDHRWINRMEDNLHPYLVEMIEKADL
jgi:hypothetical protein